MVAFPVARPESAPEELAAMVRVSEEVQANSVVTSLVEPSSKVAIAFNWVVLPIDTAGFEGVIVTDCNIAATGLFPAGVTCLAMLREASLAAIAALTLLTGAGAIEAV